MRHKGMHNDNLSQASTPFKNEKFSMVIKNKKGAASISADCPS